ncbi:hypothetical protein HWV62_14906 [Athelia sp. TMB]|nr:hypothetical protein HWV62_14906 [Athelia sp. TMB]
MSALGRPPGAIYKGPGPAANPAHHPQLRGRFNDFLDRVDDLEHRNFRLERRNEDLTEQVHDLRRQIRELQGNRSGVRPSSSNERPPATAATTGNGAAGTSTATPAATPSHGPPTAVVPPPSRLEERLETLPLSRRMDLDPTISGRSPPDSGGVAPGPPNPQDVNGDWHGRRIETVEDYDTVRDAADQGSDSALLYIGYLNATQQRVPHHRRSAGIRELLKDWGRFSKPHEVRRAKLHEKHGIKQRLKARKPSDPSGEETIIGGPAGTSDGHHAMDTDANLAPRAVSEPMPAAAPLTTSEPLISSDDVASPEDTAMGPCEDNRISQAEQRFANMNPEDWPPGIRADVDGSPVPISAQMLRSPHTPLADDVHAWEVMDSLAPALNELDPTSAARRTDFLQLSVRIWAVADYVMILYGCMRAPMGHRPVEPYPFELEPYNTVHIAAWYHDHGIEVDSETAANLHQYAVSAYPFLPGALPTGPPTHAQMTAGIAGQQMDLAAIRFQYPALHFSQPARDWTTATEDYFTEGRAGRSDRPVSSFPAVPPAVPREPRPDTGPYSFPSSTTVDAPRSAPTPEPGPSLSGDTRRSPSEEVDFEGSDGGGPSGIISQLFPFTINSSTFTLNGTPVKWTDNYTYVGVTFASGHRNIFTLHYERKAAKAKSVAGSIFSVESFVGSLPPLQGIRLYNARVDPHLTAACEVAIDVDMQLLKPLQAVQHTFLQRLIGLNPRAMRAFLFSESGLLPLAYRRIILALRYLMYLLSLPAHHYAACAWRDSQQLFHVGKACWLGDLAIAIQKIPFKRPIFNPLDVDLDNIKILIDEVALAAAKHVDNALQNSSKARLLRGRKHKNGDGIPEHRALALRPYLLVPAPKHRKALAALLLADHALAEVRLRYQERRQPPVPREWRLCRLCGDEIEEPLHALFACTNSPTLVALRASFWDKCGTGTAAYHGLAPLETLHQLLLDDNMVNVFAKFCYLVLELYDKFPMFVPAAGWLRGVLAEPADRRLHSLDIML